MSGYDQFFETYKEAIDAREVPKEVIKKYETYHAPFILSEYSYTLRIKMDMV